MSFRGEAIPRHFGRVCHVYGGEEDCFHLFFNFCFSKVIWEAQKIPSGGSFFGGGF